MTDNATLGTFDITLESRGHLIVRHEKHEIHILNWGKSYNVEIYAPSNNGDFANAQLEYRKEADND